MRLEGELLKSRDAAAATEASEYEAKLKDVEDQARAAAVLVVFEFQASDEIRQAKKSNYDQGVRDFLYIVATTQPDWDLSFLGG